MQPSLIRAISNGILVATLLYDLKYPPVCLSNSAGMEENVNFSVVIKDRILDLLSEDSSDLRAFII